MAHNPRAGRDTTHLMILAESELMRMLATRPPFQATGLDSPTLTAVLVVVALLIFLWGFKRYRTSFSKAEFGVATAIAAGTLVIALVPDLFSALGNVLRIERRPLVISLVATVLLTGLVLYVIGRLREQQLTIAELTRSLTIDQAELDDDDERTACIVIPAYNEAENVQPVVESLPETVRGHSVVALVVSDGSSDATARRAAETDAGVVEHPINQGQGGALKTGFEIARENGADVVVTIDADGQHPIDQLGNLIGPIADDQADYVVGSRYIGTDRSGNGPVRRAGIRTFTWLINVMANMDISDCTNGFRAIRGSRLDELTLTEEQFSAPELLIEARKNGLRIREIPVTIAEREHGESKKPRVKYALGLMRTILVTWIR